MASKRKQTRKTHAKALAELELMDWILYGDLIARHGPDPSEELKRIHYMRGEARRSGKPLSDGSFVLNWPASKWAEQLHSLIEAIATLDHGVFDRYSKAIRQYKKLFTKSDRDVRTRIADKSVMAGVEPITKTVAELAEEYGYKGDLRAFRRILDELGMGYKPAPKGRPKKRTNKAT